MDYKYEPYESYFLKEYFKIILKYKGHFIADINHSVDRFIERVSDDLSLYNSTLKKAIDWIIKNNKEYIEDRYIFRSKKHGFGIQLEWRKDRRDNILQGFTATTLSTTEMKYYTKNDKEVFVENIMKKGISKKKSFDIYNKGYALYNMPFDTEGYDMFVEKGNVYYTFEFIDV